MFRLSDEDRSTFEQLNQLQLAVSSHSGVNVGAVDLFGQTHAIHRQVYLATYDAWHALGNGGEFDLNNSDVQQLLAMGMAAFDSTQWQNCSFEERLTIGETLCGLGQVQNQDHQQHQATIGMYSYGIDLLGTTVTSIWGSVVFKFVKDGAMQGVGVSDQPFSGLDLQTTKTLFQPAIDGDLTFEQLHDITKLQLDDESQAWIGEQLVTKHRLDQQEVGKLLAHSNELHMEKQAFRKEAAEEACRRDAAINQIKKSPIHLELGQVALKIADGIIAMVKQKRDENDAIAAYVRAQVQELNRFDKFFDLQSCLDRLPCRQNRAVLQNHVFNCLKQDAIDHLNAQAASAKEAYGRRVTEAYAECRRDIADASGRIKSNENAIRRVGLLQRDVVRFMKKQRTSIIPGLLKLNDELGAMVAPHPALKLALLAKSRVWAYWDEQNKRRLKRTLAKSERLLQDYDDVKDTYQVVNGLLRARVGSSQAAMAAVETDPYLEQSVSPQQYRKLLQDFKDNNHEKLSECAKNISDTKAKIATLEAEQIEAREDVIYRDEKYFFDETDRNERKLNEANQTLEEVTVDLEAAKTELEEYEKEEGHLNTYAEHLNLQTDDAETLRVINDWWHRQLKEREDRLFAGMNDVEKEDFQRVLKVRSRVRDVYFEAAKDQEYTRFVAGKLFAGLGGVNHQLQLMGWEHSEFVAQFGELSQTMFHAWQEAQMLNISCKKFMGLWRGDAAQGNKPTQSETVQAQLVKMSRLLSGHGKKERRRGKKSTKNGRRSTAAMYARFIDDFGLSVRELFNSKLNAKQAALAQEATSQLAQAAEAILPGFVLKIGETISEFGPAQALLEFGGAVLPVVSGVFAAVNVVRLVAGQLRSVNPTLRQLEGMSEFNRKMLTCLRQDNLRVLRGMAGIHQSTLRVLERHEAAVIDRVNVLQQTLDTHFSQVHLHLNDVAQSLESSQQAVMQHVDAAQLRSMRADVNGWHGRAHAAVINGGQEAVLVDQRQFQALATDVAGKMVCGVAPGWAYDNPMLVEGQSPIETLSKLHEYNPWQMVALINAMTSVSTDGGLVIPSELYLTLSANILIGICHWASLQGRAAYYHQPSVQLALNITNAAIDQLLLFVAQLPSDLSALDQRVNLVKSAQQDAQEYERSLESEADSERDQTRKRNRSRQLASMMAVVDTTRTYREQPFAFRPSVESRYALGRALCIDTVPLWGKKFTLLGVIEHYAKRGGAARYVDWLSSNYSSTVEVAFQLNGEHKVAYQRVGGDLGWVKNNFLVDLAGSVVGLITIDEVLPRVNSIATVYNDSSRPIVYFSRQVFSKTTPGNRDYGFCKVNKLVVKGSVVSVPTMRSLGQRPGLPSRRHQHVLRELDDLYDYYDFVASTLTALRSQRGTLKFHSKTAYQQFVRQYNKQYGQLVQRYTDDVDGQIRQISGHAQQGDVAIQENDAAIAYVENENQRATMPTFHKRSSANDLLFQAAEHGLGTFYGKWEFKHGDQNSSEVVLNWYYRTNNGAELHYSQECIAVLSDSSMQQLMVRRDQSLVFDMQDFVLRYYYGTPAGGLVGIPGSRSVPVNGAGDIVPNESSFVGIKNVRHFLGNQPLYFDWQHFDATARCGFDCLSRSHPPESNATIDSRVADLKENAPRMFSAKAPLTVNQSLADKLNHDIAQCHARRAADLQARKDRDTRLQQLKTNAKVKKAAFNGLVRLFHTDANVAATTTERILTTASQRRRHRVLEDVFTRVHPAATRLRMCFHRLSFFQANSSLNILRTMLTVNDKILPAMRGKVGIHRVLAKLLYKDDSVRKVHKIGQQLAGLPASHHAVYASKACMQLASSLGVRIYLYNVDDRSKQVYQPDHAKNDIREIRLAVSTDRTWAVERQKPAAAAQSHVVYNAVS